MSRFHLAKDRENADYITPAEAAELLRVSQGYLRNSDCPKILLPGNGMTQKPLVRYRRSDLAVWADSHRISQTTPQKRRH